MARPVRPVKLVAGKKRAPAKAAEKPSREMSQAKLEADIAAGAVVTRLDVPAYYGTSVQAAWAGNDLNLVVRRPHPAMVNDVMPAASLEAQFSLNISAATAKDFALLLADQISQYEANWGEIHTDYTRSRAVKKN